MQAASELGDIVGRYFDIAEEQQIGENVYRYKVIGAKEGDLRKSFRALYADLVKRGYAPALRRASESLYLVVAKFGTRTNWLAWSVLAIATVVMVYISGEALVSSPGGGPLAPVLYTVGLLAPLIVHESGHWLTMRRYGVPRSPPYLIPAPPLQFGFLGTLGAVINMKWVPVDSDELALIGVMGPLAGFLAALPVSIIGLQTSQLMPATSVTAPAFPLVPVIMDLLLAASHTPSGYVVVMSPLALSGLIVFLVTFLNLIPIGQLDGGHVIRAALGERGHMVVSAVFVLLLLVLGLYYPYLGFFGVIALILLLITRGRHPGPALEGSRLTAKGYVAVVIYGLLLALTMPLPA